MLGMISFGVAWRMTMGRRANVSKNPLPQAMWNPWLMSAGCITMVWAGRTITRLSASGGRRRPPSGMVQA
jgi:hypothetical protein